MNMNENLDVKFRLKTRKKINPRTGLKEENKQNVLITMRVCYMSNRMEFSTGYHIDAFRWNEKSQLAIGPSRDGKSADEINNGIANLTSAAFETAKIFEEAQVVPSVDDFKQCFERVKNGASKPVVRKKKSDAPHPSEQAELVCSKPDPICSKPIINKTSQSHQTKEINKSLGFWAISHEFERQCGRQNNWTDATYEKFHAMRSHLKGLRDYKRKQGLKTFDFDFDYFDDEGMLSYLEYLRDVKDMKNSTIGKNLEFLRWFLRWSLHKGFHKNTQFEAFRPKLKKTQKKVVFLNKKELAKIEKYQIPESKLYLYRVRDVFLFCCYTGLRHSDAYNLKRFDVKSDHIEVTTVKTCDSLNIELNDKSKAILKKYENYNFPGDKALPVITNQKMNDYLHELFKMAGFDEQIRLTYYKGNERIDVIKPKYELIGTHTGRRTFICNALGMGIPPQVVMKWTGHSDYKSMKPYIDVADEIKAEAMKKFNDF